MADTQSNSDRNTSPYWCYNCDQRVQIQTLPDSPALLFRHCNHAFVQPISPPPPPPSQDQNSHNFVEEEGQNEEGDIQELNNDEFDEVERSSMSVIEAIRNLIGDDEGPRLDWSEVLMHLEDDSVGSEFENYVGNPGDYVDAAGYEALLQNLVDGDVGGRGGAPPAARLAVEGLDTVVIEAGEEAVLCSVCKDFVDVGGTMRKLPCGHMYHGDCIVPWLGMRNSCPICRFELPTDDPEYEEERERRRNRGNGGSARSVGVDVTD